MGRHQLLWAQERLCFVCVGYEKTSGEEKTRVCTSFIVFRSGSLYRLSINGKPSASATRGSNRKIYFLSTAYTCRWYLSFTPVSLHFFCFLPNRLCRIWRRWRRANAAGKRTPVPAAVLSSRLSTLDSLYSTVSCSSGFGAFRVMACLCLFLPRFDILGVVEPHVRTHARYDAT